MTETGSHAASVAIPTVEFDHTGTLPVLGHVRQFIELQDQYRPWVRSTTGRGFWVLTDGNVIREGLQKPDLFSSSSVDLQDPNPPYLWIPEMLDPPLHTKWRQFLAPEFAPKPMADLEPRVQSRCVELIERLVDRGRCDFLNEFAYRYPTTIFMELMGLPLDGLDQFLAWEDDILHNPGVDDGTRALQAMMAVQEYFRQIYAERREHPQDDLVTLSLSWRIDGEPIAESDLLAWCLLMFMAGLDTVAIQLSYSFWHFATHDADRMRIVNEPDLIPSAVEELLRAYSFVPTQRKVMYDADFHGCPVKAGDMALFAIPAACRDPQLFDNPNEVVLDRQPNGHIAFGAGPHRCLGSHLARRELRVALEEWHKRIPNYRIDPDVEVLEHGGMFGIDSLALRWD
jgi:cytochrome P450